MRNAPVGAQAPPPAPPPAEAPTAPEGSVARDSVLLFGAQLSGNAGFFVAVLILARSLGPQGRGSMAFVTVTALFVARVCKFGLSETTTVFAARQARERPVLLSNLLAFSVVGSLIGGGLVAAVLLLDPGLGPAELDSTVVAILVCGAVACSLWDESFLLGCRRIRQLSVPSGAGGWIYAILLSATSIGWGLTVKSAAIGWALSQAIVAVALHAPAIREFGLARPDLTLLRTSLGFGFRAWFGTLSAKLNARLDQVLMGLITTEAALGIYAVAVNASELLLYLPTAIAASLLPRIAGGDERVAGDKTLRIFRMSLLIAGGSIVVAAVAGPELLPLIFGAPFEPSVTPLLWLLPSVLGYSAMSIFTNALLGLSAPGRSSLAPVLALVTGVIFDFLLIPRYGATGAAAAATAAFCLGGTVAMLLFRDLVGFRLSALLPRRVDAVELIRLPARLVAR